MVVAGSPDWLVKITDFGISKRRRDDVTSLHTLKMGTLGYIAPEVLGCIPTGGNASYSFPVDMWSLGALTFRMLTGTVCFPTVGDLVLYALGHKPFPLGLLKSARVTEECTAFVVELMSPNADDRPCAARAAEHAWLRTPQNNDTGLEHVLPL